MWHSGGSRLGVACFGCAVAWLLWMFHTLGRNLTDTVLRTKHTVSDEDYCNRDVLRIVSEAVKTEPGASRSKRRSKQLRDALPLREGLFLPPGQHRGDPPRLYGNAQS